MGRILCSKDRSMISLHLIQSNLIMGQQVLKDSYQMSDLQGLVRLDAIPPSYIWVDRKINGAENKTYLSKFREQFQVDGQDSLEVFKAQVETWDTSKAKLRAICAASLSDQDYEFIQSNDTVDRVILFCGNKVRASNLMRDYPKIKQACFTYSEVIKTVRKWEREAETSVLFFEPQEVETVNRFSINVGALTDPSIFFTEANDNWRQYMEKLLKKEHLNKFKSFDKEYVVLRANLTSNEAGREMLIRFFKDNLLKQFAFIVEEVNCLLRSTTNPKKLAFIRCIVSDLFAAIKNDYKQAKTQQSFFSAVVSLNEEEIKRLTASANSFITLPQFLEASTNEPSSEAKLNEEEFVVKISVPAKKSASQCCNGYLKNGTQVLFNLGNYFRVKSFSKEEKVLNISLIHFEEGVKADLNNREHWLYLNQSWLSQQQEKYEGQHLALLISNEWAAGEYIKEKISTQRKEKQIREDAIFRWTLNQELWKIKMRRPLENIEKNLEALITGSEANQQAATALCELYWTYNEQGKFRAAIKRLKSTAIAKSGLPIQAQIFLLADRFLESTSQQSQREAISQLKQQIAFFQKGGKYEVSENYHLLLNILIYCLQHLSLYEEVLAVVTVLSQIYSICEGTTSAECMRLNKLKVEVMTRKDLELNKKESTRQQKLFKSGVRLEELRSNDLFEAYAIDAAKINFQLYN